MKKLYVTAALKVKTDSIKKVADILTNLALKSMQENGCENYRILQSVSEVNVFTTFEQWACEYSEKKHWETVHLKNAVENLEGFLLESPVINKYYSI